jgi:hypothetical protein
MKMDTSLTSLNDFVTVVVDYYEVKPLVDILCCGITSRKETCNGFMEINVLARMCHELQIYLDNRVEVVDDSIFPQPAYLTNLAKEDIELVLELSEYEKKDLGRMIEIMEGVVNMAKSRGPVDVVESDRLAKGL